jgi:hypothetical protein
MKRYPMIELMASRGRKIALVIGALIAFMAIVRVAFDHNFAAFAWTGLGAGFCYVAVRLLAELIEVIADTLLPR